MSTVLQVDSRAIQPMLENDIKQLAPLAIRDNLKDLSLAMDHIGEALEFKYPISDQWKDVDPQEIVARVTQCYNELKADENRVEDFAVLDRVANTLSANIQNVYNDLRHDVMPTMTALKSKILNTANKLLVAHGQSAAIDSTEAKPVGLRAMRWDEYLNLLGGSANLIQMYSDVTKYRFTSELNDIDEIAEEGQQQIEPLEIHPETKEDIEQRWTDSLKSIRDYKGVDAKQLYAIVTDSYDFSAMQYDVLTSTAVKNDFKAAVAKITTYLDKYYIGLRAIKSTPLNVTSELMDKLQANIDKCLNLANYSGMVLMCLRTHYKNAVAIDEDLVNGDTVTEFTDEGNTVEDIDQHIEMFYRSRKQRIPNSGITAEEITANHSQAAAMTTAKQNDAKEHAHYYRNMAIRAAAKAELRDYLYGLEEFSAAVTDDSEEEVGTPVEEVTPEDLDKAEEAKQAIDEKLAELDDKADQLDSSDDNNLETMLYDFILSVKYPNPITSTIHNQLGAEVIRQMKTKRDITRNDLALVDAIVSARTMASFIATNILAKAK